jgi:hypothetical protein
MASGSDMPNIAQMREEKDVEGLIEALRHDNGITIDRNISLSSDLFADGT